MSKNWNVLISGLILTVPSFMVLYITLWGHGPVFAAVTRASTPVICDGARKSGARLTLYGETHDSHVAQFHVLAQFEKMKQGKILIAVEGDFYDPTEPTGMRGFDDPVSYGLGSLLQVWNFLDQNSFSYKQTEFNRVAGYLVQNIERNPHLQKAWKALVLRTRKDVMTTTFKILSEALPKNPDSPIHFSSVQAPAEFKRITALLMEEYVRLLKTPEYKKTYFVPATVDLAVEVLRKGNFQHAVDELIVKWRNVALSANIERLYCLAVELNRDLEVNVGSDHVKDLGARLKIWSGGKLPTAVHLL